MTQTIKCDICRTTEDALEVGKQQQQAEAVAQRMFMEAQMWGMFFEPPEHKGWLYGTDLCPECLVKYRIHADPLKEQLESEKKELSKQYQDAAEGILSRMKHDAGTDKKLELVH